MENSLKDKLEKLCGELTTLNLNNASLGSMAGSEVAQKIGAKLLRDEAISSLNHGKENNG